MGKELALWQRAEQSIQKKYRKTIWRPFVTAVNQYELISAGDRIAACISGGKDSMLMAKLLQMLQRHSEVPFELVFLVMDPGYNAMNRRKIEENAGRLNIPVTFFETDIFAVANSTDRSPCYLCARMRRGYLYSKAKELGCNKIALGHHFSDVIETTVMGMFYGGQLQAMIPKLHSTNFAGMELIRPLYRVHEDDVRAWARHNGLEFIQCACRFTENAAVDPSASKRQEIKELIRRLKRDNPNIEKSIFRSIHAVSLDTFPGYKTEGREHSFLERFDRSENKKEEKMGKTSDIPAGKLATFLKDGAEIPRGPEQESTGAEAILTDRIDVAHSCELSESKVLDYRAALFVDKTGIVPEKSASAALRGGTFDDHAADGVKLESRSDDFSALIVDGGRYALRNAKIDMPTQSDGKNVCDFAGLGSVAAAFNRARLDVENCDIATEGVAKCMVYADNGADVVIRDSRLAAMGGTLYDGYVNLSLIHI